MTRKKVINRTHKNPASDGINLNAEVGGDLLGMKGGKDNPSLTAWEDVDETDPEKVGGSVAAIEATLKYVDSILKEDDEDLPEGDDVELDNDEYAVDDMEDDDEDFDDDGSTGFGDDDVADSDMEECGEGDEELGDDLGDDEEVGLDDDEVDDLEDEDMDDEDEDEDLAEGSLFFEGDEDLDDDLPEDDEDMADDLGDEEDVDLDSDEDLDADEDMDEDLAEGFLFESDESLDDTEVVSTEPDSDLDDMEDDGDISGAISVDLPEDIDPNDVEVTVGDSTYVPDIDSEEDMSDDMEDDDFEDDEDMGDMSEGVGYTGGSYNAKYPGWVEDDDADIDDVTDDEDDFDDDLPDEDEDAGDEEEDDDTLDVSEAAVLKALNNILKEDQRSDDPHTSDPSCNTGDRPVDCECEIDDSEAEEDDLSGDEGEVTDADIPIEKGTIQPEEAEIRWMANELRRIMREDEESHKDDGKLTAKPLDGDAEDIIGDIGDSLEDDGTLTDTGDGAVEDGETTLGTPDEAEEITDNDDVNVVSSNGEDIDDEDMENKLTDNYYKVMKAINEACKKGGKKGKKAAAIKKAVKKALTKKKVTPKKGKKVKMVKEGVDPYPEMNGIADYVGRSTKTVSASATATAKKGADELNNKTLENTVLGNFNKSEMNSVLMSLNNAFGTGSTAVSKEIRDAQVVSEVSVPTKALPIAENATWDGISAGKLLVETAYKSESKVNTNLLKLTHLYWINEGTNPDDYKFPIASMVEGKAQIIPEAIDEATQLFASPSFILRFSETALKKIRNVLDFYNEKMGKKSPWKSNDQIQVSEAAKITMIDRTSYNPYAVLKRLSEQENAKKLLKIRG